MFNKNNNRLLTDKFVLEFCDCPLQLDSDFGIRMLSQEEMGMSVAEYVEKVRRNTLRPTKVKFPFVINVTARPSLALKKMMNKKCDAGKNSKVCTKGALQQTVLNANKTNLPVLANRKPPENRRMRNVPAQQRMQNTYRPNFSLPANRTHPQNRQTRENQTAPENPAWEQLKFEHKRSITTDCEKC